MDKFIKDEEDRILFKNRRIIYIYKYKNNK